MNRKIGLLALIIVITLVIISMYIFSLNNKSDFVNEDDYDFKIHFFNAGKADACIISNSGKHIMIDTGEENLKDEILSYFKNNNITKIDYLIITHFDKDHVGSASYVINAIQVENVLESNVPKESTYYENYKEALLNKNITADVVSGNRTFSVGSIEMTVNGPNKIYDSNESNNSSLITKIKYGDTSYLFMGDSQNDRIKDYLEETNGTVNLIKMPYHGNYQKKLYSLLEKVQPKYAVITSSEEEIEDEDVITLLKDMNIDYYLTREGKVDVYSNGDVIIIEQ